MHYSRFENNRALFYGVAAVLTALAVAPVWVTDLLPLLDVPSHLHLITIIHHFDDEPFFPKHYQRIREIVPYLSYYQAVSWLAHVRDVEWANRIVLSAVMAAIPWSALALVRTAGHSRWLVLGVFPWIFSTEFFTGFLNFVMSVPLFLWLLAAHLRLLQRPSWWRAAFVSTWLCLLAMTHYLLWAVALGMLPLLACVFGVRQGWRRALAWPLREALVCLPSIGMLLPWFVKYFALARGPTTSDLRIDPHQGALERLRSIYAGDHDGPLENLRRLTHHLFDSVGPVDATPNLLERPGELVTAVWLCGVVLWLLGAARQDPVASAAAPAPADAPPRPGIPGGSYLAWAFGIVLSLYFVFPFYLLRPLELGVNYRLVVLIGILGVVALPVRPFAPAPSVRGRVRLGTALLAAAAIYLPVATAQAFLRARVELGALRDAYAAIPPGQAVLTLHERNATRHLRFPDRIYRHVGEYYAVLRVGYVPYSFADTSSKPVVVRPELVMPAPAPHDHAGFSWQHHGRFYDYLVAWRENPNKAESFESGLQGLPVVFSRGAWRVYRNPAPDPWPEPTPAELAARALAHARDLARLRLVRAALRSVGFEPLAAPLHASLEPLYSALPWSFERADAVAPLGWPEPRSTGVESPARDRSTPGRRPPSNRPLQWPPLPDRRPGPRP